MGFTGLVYMLLLLAGFVPITSDAAHPHPHLAESTVVLLGCVCVFSAIGCQRGAGNVHNGSAGLFSLLRAVLIDTVFKECLRNFETFEIF